jgi:NTE family protein
MTDLTLPGGVFVGPDLPRGWLARHRRPGTSRSSAPRPFLRPVPGGRSGAGRTPPGRSALPRPGMLRTGARRNPRTAFVFAGGGSRGAAQVGMIRALIERGIVPDAVYGASVGAINAGGFAGDPTLAGTEHLTRTWMATTRDDVFPQGRIHGPWRFFQQREAVHSNGPLRRLIADGVRYERLEDTPIPLEVVATSLIDGRPRWFDRGPAVEAILASTALPALLPPVQIDREWFIDGGVVDNVPVGRAMHEGAERVFALLCGPLHYTPHKARRPVEAVLTAFFIAVHARFARELERLPAGVEIIVFTVDTEPVSRYDDFSGTQALLDAGYANASRVLDFWQAGGVGDCHHADAGPSTATATATATDGAAAPIDDGALDVDRPPTDPGPLPPTEDVG